MIDLSIYFDELLQPGREKERNVPKRAPFSYMGSKYRSVTKILFHLPCRKAYVEVFGGSGVVLLNRPESPLEVFNDRHSGIAAFYKCMHDDEKYALLKRKIEETVHSREFWEWCRKTWEEPDSDVNRAFKWFYSLRLSFGHQGRNFARSIRGKNGESGRMLKSIPLLEYAHKRFQNVVVENRDALLLMEEYDHPDHVFYLDPPYIDAWRGKYKHDMVETDHKVLLDRVMSMKSFVAISSYDSALYDTYKWDDKILWKGSQCTDSGDIRSKKEVYEALYIKKEC